MRWPWDRIRDIKMEAKASLDVSHEQFNTASEDHAEARAIGEQLRDIRTRNHLAAAIEFQLRGAKHA